MWDAATGQELGILEGHKGHVLGLAVSPDGSRIASAGYDKTIRLWDAESGEVLQTMSGHAGPIGCVAFSPSGDRIVSTSDDTTLKLWNTKTGEEITTIAGHTAAVLGVAFSPDGERLASTSGGERSVRIWDSRSGELITIVRQDRPETRRVAFSPDGTRLATISYGMFSLWDTQTWQLVAEIPHAHDRKVCCVAFSPDGTQLATGAEDTTIKLWDTGSGKLNTTLSGHSQTIWSVAFSPDGSRLVSGSQDGTVKIWPTGGDNALTLKGHSNRVFCVAFSSDSKQLASGGGTVILRDAQTYEVKFRLKGHAAEVGELAFSPDGTRLASAADDNTVRLWNTETGAEVAVLKGHTHPVTGVAYSPDGTQLASASRDGTLKLWDAHVYDETATLKGHRGVLYCVVFSPEGSRLASASSDNTVKLWDARTGKEIRTFRGHDALVRSVAFGPRGERLVSAGYGTKIRVWDVASGDQIATIKRITGAIFGVAFSPDGKRIATASTDKNVNLFDARNGQEILSLYTGGAGCSAATFSPDGTRLTAAVAGNGTVQIWDAPHEHETTFLSGHTDTVTKVTFSTDGSRIYSESENERLVWDVATQENIQNAMWEPPEVIMHTSPGRRWFVTAESNNVVLVDLEYKNTSDEKAHRRAKASFDPFWHQKQANAATTAENWYAAVFHYAWLLTYEPDSLAHYVGLQASYRRLTARDPAEVEALFQVRNVTGKAHGTFYAQQKTKLVTTLPTTPFKSTEESAESRTMASSSNHALYLDGASYADVGNPPFYKASFTAEGWIKPDVTQPGSSSPTSLPGAVFTIRSGATETALAAEVFQDGRFRVIHRNPPGRAGGIDLFSQTNMTDGKWHHFAVVKGDDDMLQLYIDGSLEASSEETVADFDDTPCQVYLGVNHEKNPRYFRGLMDEIRFWDCARTNEEVNREMNSHIDPANQGLVAAYEFNQAGLVRGARQDSGTHFNLDAIVRTALDLPRGTE